MGNVIRKKIHHFFALILVFTIVLAVYTETFCMACFRNSPDINLIRVTQNDLVCAAEKGTLNEFPDSHYALFGLDGTVLAANGTSYHTGAKIDLNTLSGINENNDKNQKNTLDFISPVIRDGLQTSTLLVTIKKADYQVGTAKRILLLLPAFFFMVIIIALLLLLLRLIKNDLLAPADLLHAATKNILKGDLSTKLNYVYRGKTDELCHDFESMRKELEFGEQREKQMFDNERLLLACISHDLKTPLAAISGYVEEIRDGIADSKEKINEYSGIVLKKVQILSKLIDDILDHSKAELNEFSIEKHEVYSKDYFEATLGDISLDVAKSGLDFHVGEIPNVLIEIDNKRILQVMQNIVSNSIKYTKKGGTIDVSFAVRGKELIVSIKDTGAGIAAADLPFIFDKFYRGEKARTQSIPGSGLGLSITKYIVEKHGGRIECDSILGAGTTISFSLIIL